MEWDISAPWYRPTRLLHLVSGADFGWRVGTGSWPDWYPDSLPPVVDIGLGSPTAIKFGEKTRFPEPWKRSLFIADWSYGRVLAVRMQPAGASYSGEPVPFLSGRPLNVTDLEVGPDGSLYFLTGGRGTVSGLYRVRYVGRKAGKTAGTTPAPALNAPDAHAAARQLRRSLEKYHHRSGPEAIDAAWPHLDSEDTFIRHAARLAIEHQSAKTWASRIDAETRPLAAATALLALARGGDAADKSRWFTLWTKNAATPRDPATSLTLLRALTYQLSRHGLPDETTTAAVRQWLEVWPSRTVQERHQLCELLAFMGSPKTVDAVLRWFDEAKTQEERLRYLYVLRNVAGPWTDSQRRRFFEYLRQARRFDGAQNMPRFVSWIQDDALSRLPNDLRPGFAALLQQVESVAAPPAVVNRPFVRNWELDDLIGSLQFQASERNLERGKQMFESALCIRCHRVGKTGTAFGPDLGNVSSRFSRADILRSILQPSTVIDEKYRGVIVRTTEGKTISGQQLREDEKLVEVLTDPYDPHSAIRIPREQIEELIPSAVSPMPAGLLDTLSKPEILDLLYFLEKDPTTAGP
jgi:putative heme-binding domain-containing protein